VAENGGATSPALSSLRAGWLQRPKRLVRSYRVLEQSEDGGLLRVRVTAELDEAFMRREFDRSRGVANRGVAPGVLPVLAVGTPRGRDGAGQRARRRGHPRPVAGGRRQRRVGAAGAGRARRRVRWRWSPAAPPARARCRGTGQQAVECQLGVRLVSADAGPGPSAAPARAASRSRRATPAPLASPGPPAICCRRCCPRSAAGPGTAGDLRVVTLDLDINEPAVISPVLRALRKIGGATSTEVRRVAVGRVEVRVSSRLTAPACWPG
jgi:hypothetical protein